MTRDEAQQLVDDIIDFGVHLTTWEEEFVNEMEELLVAGEELSSTQERKLQEIHNQKV